MPRSPDSPPWSPPPDSAARVEIPDFVEGALERLAERVHNRWAEKRLAEGWRWGPVRDDKARTTPNLVPYDELSEEDKDLDRATALATIKNLYQEGFRIVAQDPARAGEEGEADAVENALAVPGALRLEAADALWRNRSAGFWQAHPALAVRFAKLASDAGWPLLAYDVASRVLAAEDRLPAGMATDLRHTAVLSLMEVGALERAARELDKIGDTAGDIEGLRGRLAKMQGLRASTPEAAMEWFARARGIYEQSYARSLDRFRRGADRAAADDAYYLGINAAALAAWSGHTDEGRRLATEVLEICDDVAARPEAGEPGPWLLATRGEAHLLRGEYDDAGRSYRAAGKLLAGRWRAVQSMRRQALETAARTGVPRDLVDAWFERPVILNGGLGAPAGPARDGALVFYFLHDPAGIDEAETLAAGCSELHLCFEEPLAAFRARCNEAGRAKLDHLVARSTRLHGAENPQMAGEALRPPLPEILFRGACLLRARELDLEAALPPEPPALRENAPFRTIVCADVKGYSRLDARGLESFIRDYLGLAARTADRFRDSVLVLKTAGDGLFAVFRDLRAAVGFSLALRDAVASADWPSRGLPEDMGIRISIDAGPVLEFRDPVTGQPDVAGRIVNRAARIEPITPVNHVYASRTVASLSLALGLEGARFEYAGETPLPKGFGAFPLYHVAPA